MADINLSDVVIDEVMGIRPVVVRASSFENDIRFIVDIPGLAPASAPSTLNIDSVGVATVTRSLAFNGGTRVYAEMTVDSINRDPANPKPWAEDLAGGGGGASLPHVMTVTGDLMAPMYQLPSGHTHLVAVGTDMQLCPGPYGVLILPADPVVGQIVTVVQGFGNKPLLVVGDQAMAVSIGGTGNTAWEGFEPGNVDDSITVVWQGTYWIITQITSSPV